MKVFGIERDYIIHDESNIKGFFGEYRWLSNFEVCDIYFDGELYDSTEAAYMAGKTTDSFLRSQFNKKSNITPKEARDFGRRITLRPDWDKVRYDTMSAVVFDKFYRNLELREKLLATGNKYLEETNHWGDQYWGVCDGKGESNLGKILMSVRKFWQDKDKDKPKQLF
jgi:ribA/ribD-fused uncharacterized protein